MIARFDDSSLDATRRSIILYTLLALALYHYQPSVGLNGLLETAITFKKSDISPSTYGFVLLLALFYLYLRLLVWLPLHMDSRGRNFSSLQKSLRQEVQRIVEAVAAAQGQYDKVAELLEPMETAKLARIPKDIEDVVPRYVAETARLSEAREVIRAEFDELKQDLYDKIVEVVGKGEAPGKFSDKEWQNFLADAERKVSDASVSLTGTIHTPPAGGGEFDVPDFSALFAAAKTQEEVKALLESASSHLEETASNFSFEDMNILNVSNVEIEIFARWLPLLIVAFGISASIGLVFEFSGWSDLILKAFPIVFLMTVIGAGAARSFVKR